jgi:proteasome lid subunit RPN8/RPN11
MTTLERHVNDAAPSRMSGRVRQVSLPLLAIPDQDGYTEHATTDGARVFIADTVLEVLARLERAHHPNETAGLLFGRHFTDGQQTCTLVTELITPEPGEVEGTPSYVTITAAGARQMRARARRLIPCADPVGWGHTHPTFPPFFSGTDRAEQRLWTEPTSVGIVLSGIRDATELYHVYVGPESNLAAPVARHSPRLATAMPVDAPVTPLTTHRNRPALRAKRGAGLIVYRTGLAGAAAAALILAAGSWRIATTARQTADQASALSASVSHTAKLAGQQTRSGQQTAALALSKSHAASIVAARTASKMRAQVRSLRARAAASEKVAASATAVADRALQQSEVDAASLAAFRAQLAARDAAAAQSAKRAATNQPKAKRATPAPHSTAPTKHGGGR